ncbi:MAG TPA: circularly permuted type 2 ATP-grasp protein [Acidimicrobiales bacterium]
MDRAVTLAAYSPEPGRYDELTDERGQVREPWQQLVDTFTRLGPGEINERRLRAERLLVAEGASHVVHDDGTDASRPWQIDPVPLVVSAREWSVLEQGLVQRARLLDAVLEDLYGDRALLRDGVVPAELVLGSRAYRPACHGVVPAAGRRLVVYGADVVRDGSGRWCVLADHADAPSGAGYAVLNRTVLTRLFPDTYRALGVRAMADYFASLRSALAALAPTGRDNPRVVILTPGIGHPSYFEHSYLASYLGYNLVEGDDLAVRGGRVWLRARAGLEPIDTVLRRVDDAGADPLELEPESATGVPGLVEATREHGVGVANAPGSAIAGSLALQAYLDVLCPYLLGERLRLAPLTTLWCGDPDQRATVLDQLDRMVLHDTDPVAPLASAFGGDLTEAEADAWRQRIRRAPHRYAAQEKVVFATTPVLQRGAVTPGTVVVRAQVVAAPDGYAALPGGLGRIVDAGRPLLGQPHGTGKDVWVAAEPDRVVARVRRRQELEIPQIDLRASLPSRAAEALYWFGRRAEQAEAVSRLVRAVVTRAEDEPELVAVAGWRRPALAAIRTVSGGPLAGTGPVGDDIATETALALDGRSGSVTDSLWRLHRSAESVREFLSTTTWRVLGMLEAERTVLEDVDAATPAYRVVESLDRVVLAESALAGLATDATVRGPAWRFLDIGRRLERALLLLGVVEAALAPVVEPEATQPLYETVLTAVESLVEYRRRHRSDVALDAVLSLVLVDDTNPRSLAFQLDRLTEDLAGLPHHADREHHAELVEASARALFETPWREVEPEGAGRARHAAVDHTVLAARAPLLQLADAFVTRWFADQGDGRQFHRGAG